MGLIAVGLAGFVAALLTPFLWQLSRRATDWAVPAVPLCLTLYFASLIGPVTSGETITGQVEWVAALDVRLSFAVDGLSLLFALLITGVGTLVMLYSADYLHGRDDRGRFHVLMLLFMSSMLGLVLADNLIALIIFWELTTISSFFLIGFEHREDDARSSAWTALIVTGIGGQALLAGLVLLGVATDSWVLSEIVTRGDLLRGHDLYLPILLLVALGAFTKSAQVPFHFWLPGAMVAPTPVSAYLHSATMVKAGIYLLARLHPALGGTDSWLYMLSFVGAGTMLAAAYLAFQQSDLKRILAYATISALGTMVMLLGLGTHIAIEAAMVMLVVHSFYKGALFLVAGAVDHATGTRDVTRLGGLWRAMPLTAAAALLAGASIAGLPPFGGFVSKELLYDSVFHGPLDSELLTVLALASKTFLVIVSGIVAIRPFFGTAPESTEDVNEVPVRMWFGLITLAVAGLTFGIMPGIAGGNIIEQASRNVTGDETDVDLQLWHGFSPILLLSALTIVTGAAGYLLRDGIRGAAARLEPLGRFGPERGYPRAIDGLNWLATTQTRIIQSGYLRYYLLATILTTVALAGGTLLLQVDARAPDFTPDIRVYEFAVAAIIAGGAAVAIRTDSRLGALVALGVVGYGIAMIYLFFGAIDLAIIQILIETLTVILFILMFYHLPHFALLSSRATRVRDAVIALSAGALMTALVIVATDVQFSPSVSEFYIEEVRAEEHRSNVVDAIITDFRNLDTLGEITVLALAGIGVFALLKLRLEGPDPPRRSVIDDQRIESLILSGAVRFLVPLMLLFSVFLFLRGPTEPGGGFAGGIVASTAVVLFAIQRGIDHARQVFPLSHHLLLGAGLILAMIAGMLPLVIGDPFLTAVTWQTWTVPGVGAVELGNTLIFESGVYLLVVGVTLMIVFSIGEE